MKSFKGTYNRDKKTENYKNKNKNKHFQIKGTSHLIEIIFLKPTYIDLELEVFFFIVGKKIN